MNPKLNPVLSETHQIIPFYLFEITAPGALTASICQFFLMKVKGVNGSLKINQEASKCHILMSYSYHVAADSSPSSLL